MELESRIQALEAHVTQLVQKVVKPMATNMADGEEQAAEILPASAAGKVDLCKLCVNAVPCTASAIPSCGLY